MVISMTGYGQGEAVFSGRTITVELRSVNNRYFDCAVRIPRIYLFMEEQIKSAVQQEVSRGKVDVFVTIDSCDLSPIEISINQAVAEGYYKAYSQLSEIFEIPNDLTASCLAKLPDVLSVEKAQENTDEIREQILTVVSLALKDFHDMRCKEGEKLRSDLLDRCMTVEHLLQKIEARSPRTVEEYQQKLENRIKDLLDSKEFDETRILTEAAIFADKVAISEETVRLHSHLSQLREMLNLEGSVGRKLDFLIQEFNREANTIGSKCSDLEMSRFVVDMKGEIEKMREQTQNIE